ncbi:hypothetical protein C3941_23720 [Kaistia algarum]|uniref:hypothetical protein n=1 Tax=Kaistia algarum TaxID=2083279 RepID=UPI000CE82D38|nr:hypothetical protein [Kaistia algarum]MCX5513401.1 hypothetical protein [Kaistia algarum]PPE77407.1 hypothetical protein C3941_23720 [Kaistia algarum]
MGQPARTAGEEHFAAEQAALDARIDRLVEAHGGDWRAAIEVMLIALDYRTEQIAYGFVRGRLQR